MLVPENILRDSAVDGSFNGMKTIAAWRNLDLCDEDQLLRCDIFWDSLGFDGHLFFLGRIYFSWHILKALQLDEYIITNGHFSLIEVFHYFLVHLY